MRRALLLVAATAAAAPAPISIRSLIWNLAPVGDRVGPTSVSWTDDHGKVVWTASIPEGLRFSVGGANPSTWLMSQRTDDGYAKYWAAAVLGDAIALDDGGDLIVLDVADGHTRFAFHTENHHDFSDALFDFGDVDVSGPHGQHCAIHVAQKQNFLVACDGTLIFFDKGLLAAFAGATGKKLGASEWRGPELEELQGKCPGEVQTQVDQTRTVAGWTVHVHGTRATTCMD